MFLNVFGKFFEVRRDGPEIFNGDFDILLLASHELIQPLQGSPKQADGPRQIIANRVKLPC